MRDLPDDFQLDQLTAALCFVQDFSLALDIGAHRGIWTNLMLDRFKKVVAIEPTDLASQIDQRAEILNVACGAQAGTCRMQQGKRNTGQSFVSGPGNIPVITVDSLQLSPSFIKIDVEGMEYQVLKGARETLKRSKPVVIIEENGLCKRYGKRIGQASLFLTNMGARNIVTFYMPPEKDENKVYKFK